MENNIYREESVHKLNSPDGLNEYIKVANSGVWMLLVAILVLTLGGLIWCILARLESKVDSAVVVKNEVARCYLLEDNQQYIRDEMTITIGDNSYPLGEHSSNMEKLDIDDEQDEVYLHIMNQDSSGWYMIYEIADVKGLEDGVYKGVIVIDSIRPISFILNGR